MSRESCTVLLLYSTLLYIPTNLTCTVHVLWCLAIFFFFCASPLHQVVYYYQHLLFFPLIYLAIYLSVLLYFLFLLIYIYLYLFIYSLPSLGGGDAQLPTSACLCTHLHFVSPHTAPYLIIKHRSCLILTSLCRHGHHQQNQRIGEVRP